MALTRDYRETIVERVRSEPEFAHALFLEALNALLSGDRPTALSLLRDVTHGCVTFKVLAKESGLNEKSLHRMLSHQGNPTTENLSLILSVISRHLPGKGRKRGRGFELELASR